MSREIFSQSWAEAWAAELNRSGAYREAARDWEWPIAFILEGDVESGAPDRGVYLDLWRGECRQARAADADRIAAPFVVVGPAPVWSEILAGRLDPVMALLRRKLAVRKGKVLTLARYSAAARELVAAAVRVDDLAPDISVDTDGELGRALTRPAPAVVFASTSASGLDHGSFPMRLYQKAKRLGIWNPVDIDLTKDIDDWRRFDDLEREVLLHLTSLFQAGEESVAQEIVPLIAAISRERRIEEEMYLATFVWEEAKHTEFFRRFLDEVAGDASDLSRFHGANYRSIFYQELPEAMRALLDDPSSAAQARAAVTYNMIVEGTLAETGYYAYHAMLERNQLLPGLREGIGHLKRDESRHIAYGIYLLSRLVAAEPALWEVVEGRMESLLDPALGVIHELFDAYESLPFGLVIDDFLGYALGQFEKRLARLEQARKLAPEEVAREMSGLAADEL